VNVLYNILIRNKVQLTKKNVEEVRTIKRNACMYVDMYAQNMIRY